MKIQGLEIKIIKNLNCPVLICQLCKKQISGKGEGMVFYNYEGGVVAHKECMGGLKNNMYIYPGCEELNTFFYDLLHNTKEKPKNWGIVF